jgi:hypothetical protein
MASTASRNHARGKDIPLARRKIERIGGESPGCTPQVEISEQALAADGEDAAAEERRSTEESMKTLLAFLAIFVVPGICHAESRSIVVEIEKPEKGAVMVSIHSEVKSEKKQNITIAEASTILKGAKGWGSSVWVILVVRGASVKEYKPLLDAIAENVWLELIAVRSPRHHDFTDNVMKNYGVEQRNQPDRQ